MSLITHWNDSGYFLLQGETDGRRPWRGNLMHVQAFSRWQEGLLNTLKVDGNPF